ncbi:hypothetical protein Q5P01_025809 [Channa striata]|uniref:NACHT, LRR and PYD domains-containing protein 12 n=1 Tax=Channa striata TaxID=64152 RepID=A0AA88LP98_CHASR|nr:hypothetical protein Q5P01_025809 [Channa striata]
MLLSAELQSPPCRLETLRLSSCLSTGEGRSLAPALRSYPTPLREMDLRDNQPEDSGVELLSAGLENPHRSLDTVRMENEGERLKSGLRKWVCELTLDTSTLKRFLL